MTLYFERPGKEHTEEVLREVKKRAEELGIKKILVASTTGYTAEMASEILGDKEIIVVTHSYGFKKENENEFPEELRKKLEERGIKVLTATHALSGVERAIRKQLGTWLPVEIVANALRIFCEGMKVCVEIAMMAADSGLVRTDQDIIAVAGTARGADTAVVLRPAYTFKFFDMKIKEIICMPRNR